MVLAHTKKRKRNNLTIFGSSGKKSPAEAWDLAENARLPHAPYYWRCCANFKPIEKLAPTNPAQGQGWKAASQKTGQKSANKKMGQKTNWRQLGSRPRLKSCIFTDTTLLTADAIFCHNNMWDVWFFGHNLNLSKYKGCGWVSSEDDAVRFLKMDTSKHRKVVQRCVR